MKFPKKNLIFYFREEIEIDKKEINDLREKYDEKSRVSFREIFREN
jgi:hypothetical protein